MSAAENDMTRYHPQVRRAGGAWGRPSVGGIGDGFTSAADARDLISVLTDHDADYYAGCAWRVVEVTTRVIPPAATGESA